MALHLAALFVLALAVPASAWRTVVAGTPNPGRATAIAVTAAGNVVAAGRYGTAAAGDDGIVVMLAGTDGDESWRAVVAGSAGGDDIVRDVVVMPSGDVAVFGQVTNTTTGTDGLVALYDGPSGGLVWRKDLDGGSAGGDNVRDGAVLGDDLVAVGSSTRPDAKGPFTVWRLGGTDGHVVWQTQIDGAGGVARWVAVTADAVYVAGHVDAGTGGTSVIVAKLDAATGAVAWNVIVAGSGNPGDAVEAITLVGSTRVVVGTELANAGTGPDLTVVGLDPASGAESWREALDGSAPGEDDDRLWGLGVDGGGAVYAAGTLANDATNDDVVVRKLDGATGNEQWRTVIDGPTSRGDQPRAIAVDADGDVVVCGRLRAATQDFAVVKLAGASGSERWRTIVDGATSGSDIALAIAVDASGDVAAGGLTVNGPGGDELTVVRLAGATGGSFPCGNGATDPGEGCDDANLALGDGCRPDCSQELCGDGIEDPQEACDPGIAATGSCCDLACAIVDDDTPCDDANGCTTSDTCQSGVCTGDAIVCPPVTGQCIESSCNTITGQCQTGLKSGGTLCDDGNGCTTLDRCVGSQCVGSMEPSCDDAETCTDDSCVAPAGCVHTPRTGVTSAACVLERTTIAAACGADVPAAILQRLERARTRLENAALVTAKGRRKRLLKGARSVAGQAMKVATKLVKRHKLGTDCGDAVIGEMTDLRSRIDALI